MIVVRPAVPSDAKGVCDVWNPLISQSATTFNSEVKVEGDVASMIEARGGAFFVALEVNRVLGFATYFPFRGGVGYARTKEHTINLSPDAQGRGVGRELMAVLERHARGSDVHSLWAGISAENAGGVAFHERVGFVEVARLPEVGYKFGRWMDLVLMQKML